MKTAKEWMKEYDPAWCDDHGPTILTEARVEEIQRDAIRTNRVREPMDSIAFESSDEANEALRDRSRINFLEHFCLSVSRTTRDGPDGQSVIRGWVVDGYGIECDRFTWREAVDAAMQKQAAESIREAEAQLAFDRGEESNQRMRDVRA